MQALRQALHQLRAHPWFNAVVVILLALGIAATTTMFSLVHAILLKPLPYPQPGELMLVRKQPTAGAAAQPGRGEMVTDKEFLAWAAAEVPGFQAFGGYTTGSGNWRRTEGAESLSIANVTAGFFPLLGVRPHRGRLLTADDTRAGAAPVAVLSYDLWQNRLGATDAVIGTQLVVDNDPVTIVGVLPPSFQFTEPAQFWRPLVLHQAAATGGSHQIRITLIRALARVESGTDLTAAQARLDQVSARLWENLPAPGGPGGGGDLTRRMVAGLGAGPVQLLPLQEHVAGSIRPVLGLLSGAVTLVLLIACVNVANLQLARATVRRHEFAVRTALGAGRRQLVWGLLAESLAPALLGGALGLLLSFWGLGFARSLLAAQLPRMALLEINLPVAAFSLLLAALTGVAFGLAPAWSIRHLAPQHALHPGGRTGTGSPGRQRWRQACVAAEIALALALVANAGLLLKSYLNLRAVDLGFRTDALVVPLPAEPGLAPGQPRGPDPAALLRIRELAARYREAIAVVPGVRQAVIADRAPLSDFGMRFMTNIEGYTPASDAPQPPLSASAVSAGYFEILGLPLREGRYLGEGDGEGAPSAVVVNEAFGRHYFPGQPVVGRRIASPVRPGDWATIVGIVGDSRRNGHELDPPPHVYFSFDQWPQSRFSALISHQGDAEAVAPAVLKALRAFRPEVAFTAPTSLQERLDRTLAPRRLVMGLLVGFAIVAVLLAALGIFGVMAYAVAQRTHEFGIRAALGADRGRILRHVLAGAATSVALGVAGGLGLAFAGSRLLESTLFAVTRHDPAVLGIAALGLGVTGLAASVFPALRASRVDPTVALRAE